MGRFETGMLTQPENLAALADLPGRWIDAVHDRRPPKSITLDMDSSESPVHGDQEGAAWNGHFQSKCLHPLFVFNQFGDLERCALRPGNVHSADGWEEVLRPVLARYSAKARPSITRRRFRADAAFAIPALFDLLEAEGWDYAIRIKGNPKLYDQIGWLTKRRPGRPPNHIVRHYTSFHYRAKSWSKPRRVVAKVEFHPGELFPRVGFIVTNRSLPNERVLAFYNGRGTAEQYIKEGKYALKWTRLSCMRFLSERRAATASRPGLQSRQFPAHAGDARRYRDLVADVAARAADQDRHPAGAPCPLRHLPVRRSSTAAISLCRHPRPDQRPARATDPGCMRMTGTAARSPERGIGDGTGMSGARKIMLPAVPAGRCCAIRHRQGPSERATGATSALTVAFSDAIIITGKAYGEFRIQYLLFWAKLLGLYIV